MTNIDRKYLLADSRKFATWTLYNWRLAAKLERSGRIVDAAAIRFAMSWLLFVRGWTWRDPRD